MENKEKGLDIRFVTMSAYVEDVAIIVDKFKDYVKFGSNNELPKLLDDTASNVSIHGSLLDRKTLMSYGEGLSFDTTNTTDAQLKKSAEFLANINPYETADELIYGMYQDWWTFGGTYLKIIWERGGANIKEVYKLPFFQVRSGKHNSHGQVTEFYYNLSEENSKRWRKSTMIQEGVHETIPSFSTSKNKKEQIYYIKKPARGFGYYALPDYIGVLKDLETFAAISDFHNSNIHNGMQGGMLVVLSGPGFTPKDEDTMYEMMKEKQSNTGNAGKIMMVSKNKDQEVEVTPMGTSDVADMYEKLSRDVKENILEAHNIPNALAGYTSTGILGNTKEELQAHERMMRTYIQPMRQMLLNKFNVIMQVNGLAPVIAKDSKPIILASEVDLETTLTLNERREILRYEPIGSEEAVEEAVEEVKEETDTTKIKE